MTDHLRRVLTHPELQKLARYALCGGSGVLADLTTYTSLFFLGVGYQVANAAGYALGTLLSFVLNRHFTFKVYDKTVRRLVLFFATAGMGYIASTMMLWWLVEHQQLQPILAKIITLGFVLVLQFSSNRAITFR